MRRYSELYPTNCLDTMSIILCRMFDSLIEFKEVLRSSPPRDLKPSSERLPAYAIACYSFACSIVMIAGFSWRPKYLQQTGRGISESESRPYMAGLGSPIPNDIVQVLIDAWPLNYLGAARKQPYIIRSNGMKYFSSTKFRNIEIAGVSILCSRPRFSR